MAPEEENVCRVNPPRIRLVFVFARRNERMNCMRGCGVDVQFVRRQAVGMPRIKANFSLLPR